MVHGSQLVCWCCRMRSMMQALDIAHLPWHDKTAVNTICVLMRHSGKQNAMHARQHYSIASLEECRCNGPQRMQLRPIMPRTLRTTLVLATSADSLCSGFFNSHSKDTPSSKYLQDTGQDRLGMERICKHNAPVSCDGMSRSMMAACNGCCICHTDSSVTPHALYTAGWLDTG